MGEDELLRKHILLVEDERFVRESIARLLSKDEHTAVEANNGAEAFALFTRSEFDLTPRKWMPESALGTIKSALPKSIF